MFSGMKGELYMFLPLHKEYREVLNAPKKVVSASHIWVFPKIVVPQNGWFTMENPIKMADLGVPLFLETPIC